MATNGRRAVTSRASTNGTVERIAVKSDQPIPRSR